MNIFRLIAWQPYTAPDGKSGMEITAEARPHVPLSSIVDEYTLSNSQLHGRPFTLSVVRPIPATRGPVVFIIPPGAPWWAEPAIREKFTPEGEQKP
jgi:hypothetical protein